MDQVVDCRETGVCAKWTLGGVMRPGTLRTVALLAAAAFAALLAVDLPVSATRAADGQEPAQGAVRSGAPQAYVPASDKWIELGVPQRPATPLASDRLQADLLERAGVTGAAAGPPRDLERPQSHRKPSMLAAAPRRTSRSLRSARTHPARPRPARSLPAAA